MTTTTAVVNHDGITAKDTMTVPAFLKRAERMFRTSNSDVAATATLTWIVAEDGATVRRYRDASNRPGMNAFFEASAPGFRTRRMQASWSPDGMVVR